MSEVEGTKIDEKQLELLDLWDENYRERMAQAGERINAPQNVIDYYRRPQPPPLEVAARFLRIISDLDGWDEIQQEIRKDLSYAPRGLIVSLRALEKVLATPQEKDVYAKLVAWDFNWSLDDPSDEGAKAHLQKLAAMMREALGELAPPQTEESR